MEARVKSPLIEVKVPRESGILDYQMFMTYGVGEDGSCGWSGNNGVTIREDVAEWLKSEVKDHYVVDPKANYVIGFTLVEDALQFKLRFI